MHHNSGKGKMVVIMALAGVALAAGLGIFMLKGKKPSKPVKPPTVEMALGEFVVNLADPNETRYLKADIVLEVEGPLPAAEGGGEGEGKGGGSPKIRDAVIQVLSSKHFAELVKPEGKEELKKEIIAAINGGSEEKATEEGAKDATTKEGGDKHEAADKEAATSEGSDENQIKAVGVYFNEFAMQ